MCRTFISDLIRVEIEFVQLLNEMRLFEMVELRKVFVILLEWSGEELRLEC